MIRPTIESIELTNFMCHRHFAVNFASMHTCITGRNGSGKSAIMMALGLLFGQRAQALDRGNSYKGLIRTGCNQAVIGVVLNNSLGFRQDKYGTKIRIEKRLRNSGTRLLLCKQGVMATASTGEIAEILEEYGLRFDNPLNFLTQEQSKKLLNAAGPGELYEFYYNGSGFKRVNEELEESFQRLEEMRRQLDDNSLEYKRVCKELKRREGDLRFLSIDYKAELQRLGMEEEMVEIGQWIGELLDYDRRLSESSLEIESKKEANAKRHEEIASLVFNPRSTADNDKRLGELRLSLHGAETDLAEYRKEASVLAEALERAHARDGIDGYRTRLNALETNLKELDIEAAEARETKQAERAVREEAENEKARTKKYALEKQIAYLQKNSRDPGLERTVEQLRRVKEAIGRMGLTKAVVGPLCECLRLRDQRWCKAVNVILRKSLFSFIVFKQEDKRALIGLFKDLGVDFPVSLFSSRVPISYGRAVDNSLLDVLDLVDPIVVNQLVIFHTAEKIMLVPTRDEAHRIVRSGQAEKAYTPSGDLISMTGGSLSDFRAKDGGPAWFEDSSAQIARLEMEMRSLEPRTVEKMAWERERMCVAELKRTATGIEREVEQLRARIASLEEENNEDVGGLERRSKGLSRCIKALEQKLGEITGKQAEEVKKKAEIEGENSRVEQAIRMKKKALLGEADKADLEVAMLSARVAELNNSKRRIRDALYRRIKAITKGLAAVESTSVKGVRTNDETKENKEQPIREQNGPSGDAFEANWELTATGNVAYYDLLPAGLAELARNPRDRETIASEKLGIMQHMEEAGRMRPLDEIKREVGALAREKKLCEAIRDKFEHLTKETLVACQKRVDKREEIKTNKTAEATSLFARHAAKGGYEGNLTFDHEKRLLHVQVRVHSMGMGGGCPTLSGGERSFTAVCLLLSLWGSFHCPVKFLDEFDVFMDALNRKTAIQMLFGYFRESNTQAILITPLSTEEMENVGCEVHVLARED